jgi:hypothetical protein
VSNIVFLAPAVDSVTATTVHGAGHAASITDEAYVQSLIASGKAAYQGAAIRNVRLITRAATTAQLGFTVDQACTAMAANYGTTTAYGSTQAATPASGTGDVVVNLTGLTTATLYHYRITVTVGTFVTLTGDYTFTTA